MKNDTNMTLLNETNKAPMTESQVMKSHTQFDKKLKIIILKKLNELQYSIDRQINEIWKIIYKEN